MGLSSENKFSKIDEYLNNEMSPADMDKFRAFMQSDADLALDVQLIEKFESYQQLQTQENDLRSTLSDIHRENVLSNNNTAKSNTSRFAIVGLVLLALLASLFYIFNQIKNDTQPEQIYQQFAMGEPLHLITKGDNKVLDLRQLQELYNNKSYEQALPLIEQYLAKKPQDQEVLLSYAISLSELGNTAKAKTILHQITDLNPRVRKDQYYLALISLKEGQIQESKTMLEKIVSDKSYNYKKAELILQKLK